MTRPSTDLIIKPPAVLENVQFVETPTGPAAPPPMPAPKPTSVHVRLSIAVLFGSLIAAGFGVHGDPAAIPIVTAAVIAALGIFLICLGRYTAVAGRIN
jgi:hypothetical protein